MTACKWAPCVTSNLKHTVWVRLASVLLLFELRIFILLLFTLKCSCSTAVQLIFCWLSCLTKGKVIHQSKISSKNPWKAFTLAISIKFWIVTHGTYELANKFELAHSTVSLILKDEAKCLSEVKNERPLQTILTDEKMLRLHNTTRKNDWGLMIRYKDCICLSIDKTGKGYVSLQGA